MSSQIDTDNTFRPQESRLTAQDRLVLEKLGEVWNEYLKLPNLHPEERAEFRSVLHLATAIIQARPEIKIEMEKRK